MAQPATEQSSNDFLLDGNSGGDAFQLEAPIADSRAGDQSPSQIAFWLPQEDAEHPPESPQLELDGVVKPAYRIRIRGEEQALKFQHARTLLESLESQDVRLPYQCRDGYCGCCRMTVDEGEVAYLQEPLAMINEGEILPCCCVPKTNLKLHR